MTDIPTRLRDATEGSRELDAAIRHDLFGDMTRCDYAEGSYCVDEGCDDPGCGKWLGMYDERKSYPLDWRDDDRLPHYTTSIGAALTLVPEGWHINLSGVVGEPDWGVSLTKGPGCEVIGLAPTPDLTLCIAALKARMAKEDAGG